MPLAVPGIGELYCHVGQTVYSFEFRPFSCPIRRIKKITTVFYQTCQKKAVLAASSDHFVN